MRIRLLLNTIENRVYVSEVSHLFPEFRRNLLQNVDTLKILALNLDKGFLRLYLYNNTNTTKNYRFL